MTLSPEAIVKAMKHNVEMRKRGGFYGDTWVRHFGFSNLLGYGA